MKITPKQGKWGYALIGLAVLLFLGYWYYLLEPLQLKLIEAHKAPSLIMTTLRSVLVATSIAFLTFVGGALAGFAWQKWASETDLKLGDALESESFLKWAAWWNVCWLLFSLFWKYGNF